VFDLAQGNVAKLIDAAAVHLLWRVARGRASEQEKQAALKFPAVLYIPGHVHLPVQAVGGVVSVVGTWSRDNLLDYLASGPGLVREGAPAGSALWAAAVGTEAAFPVPLPTMAWHTREAGCAYAFRPAEGDLFEPDSDYLLRTAAWYRREAERAGIEEREREGALSAARIAELWVDSVRKRALEGLDAYELEVRLRRMGMAAGDSFAQRFGWTQVLLGVDAMRAFNRLLAPWVAATLMPGPFRLGMIDRCLAHPGLCAILLAASAASANLARAAAESTTAPRSLPVRGVKYAGRTGMDPATDTVVMRIVKAAHGTPVFSPLSGSPEGLWEMFIAVKVDKIMRPGVVRQPAPLALRREMESLHGLVIRVGPGATEGTLGLETVFFSDTTTVGEVDRQVAVSGGAAGRALRALWRSHA